MSAQISVIDYAEYPVVILVDKSGSMSFSISAGVSFPALTRIMEKVTADLRRKSEATK